MTNTVLIISAKDDAHIPFVTKHIEGFDVVRIDPIDIIKGESLAYKFSARTKELQILYNGKKLPKVKSVWYRRPTPIEAELIPVSKKNQEYSASSIFHHVSSLYHLLSDSFWLPGLSASRRASAKPLQLKLATKVGLNVPDTIFTSDAKQAEDFVKKHRACIAKTLSTSFPAKSLVFAKIIRSSDKLDFTGLNVDPYIFQQLIKPKLELRVTVVGNKVFAASVGGDGTDGEKSLFRDWRYAHITDTFKAQGSTLPADVKEACVNLVKEFGLAFGAIDMILDNNNKYWFLEVNVNGQWAFVEEATGQPIGLAVAKLLMSGGRPG
jgi:hypothetical protein